MTQVAAEPLLDLPMVERLCRNWMDLGARTEHSWAVRCAGILAGPADLEKLIARRDLDLASRADALAQYCDLPGAVERVCRAGFRALAEESGYDRIVTRPWMLHLDKRRDYAEIQRAAEGWLAHHDPSFGLMWHVYRGRLAHGLAMQGRNAEAWKIIEPELSTGQGSILLWGSQILARMGRTDEALQLGRASVQRYPDGYEQRAVLAELLWRADRDSEAALALEPPEPAYRVYEGVWMEDVAPRFADVFRGKSDERVEAAMRTLQAQGIYSRKLSRLVPPLAAAGRNELAFRLLMSFPQKHLHWWDIAGYDKDAFAYLEKAQGRAAATAWLQKAVVPAEREALLEAFFDHRAYAFLWDGVPAGEDARLSEWLWLLRAGAVAADPAIAAAHRKDVAEHFRDAMPNDPTRTWPLPPRHGGPGGRRPRGEDARGPMQGRLLLRPRRSRLGPLPASLRVVPDHLRRLHEGRLENVLLLANDAAAVVHRGPHVAWSRGRKDPVAGLLIPCLTAAGSR